MPARPTARCAVSVSYTHLDVYKRQNLDRYELGIAAQKIYDFIWDSYCDWYIELTKERLNSGDAEAKEGAERVLLHVLTGILKLLHPFMPYITEEIFQALPHEGEALIVAPVSYTHLDVYKRQASTRAPAAWLTPCPRTRRTS